MPRNLFKLFGTPSFLMEEADESGKDLPGGKTADELAAEKAEADKVAAETKAKAEAEEAERLKKEAEAGGGNKPSDAEAKLLKELMDYKAKAKTAAEELKAFKEAAGDSKPEDLRTLIEAKKAAEREALEKRGEYDRVLEQVKGEHAKNLETLRKELEEAKLQLSQRDDNLVELTVGRAFSESPFIREKSILPASIARKEFGAHVDLVDGVAVVYDKPRGAAERTPLVDGAGKHKSFEDGIAALYASHPEAASMIRAAVKPGAGSQTTDLGGKKPGDEANKAQVTGAGRIAAALNAAEKK